MSDGRVMSCPTCGSKLELIKGRWSCPRCDYYKNPYQGEWERHSQNVKSLAKEIEVRFPQVSLTTGLGATSAERLDIPPRNKNEPDIEVWLLRKHVLSIEVTGSNKVRVPPENIHILRKKLPVAEKSLQQGIDYLFYTVYPNNTFTLTVPIVYYYRLNIVSSGRVLGEYYIKIPPTQALSRKEVFRRIRNVLSPFYPQMELEAEV